MGDRTIVTIFDECEAIEMLWSELSYVAFYEDDTGEMYLESNWFLFDAGTSRLDIWEWFDKHYNGGVHSLMFPDNKTE